MFIHHAAQQIILEADVAFCFLRVALPDIAPVESRLQQLVDGAVV
ncbi:hypothetical protein GCM10023078_00010 [Gibbsiella greigii]